MKQLSAVVRFLCASFAIIVAANLFLFRTSIFDSSLPYLGWITFSAVVVIAFLVAVPKFYHRRTSLSLAMLLLVLAGVSLMRSNPVVFFLNLGFGTLLAGCLWLVSQTRYFNWHLLTFPGQIFNLILSDLERFKNLFSFGKLDLSDSEHRSHPFQVVILTIIVVAFFGWLLTSADPIFSRVVEDLVRQTWQRLILSAVSVGIFIYLVATRSEHNTETPQLRFLSYSSVIVPLLAVAGLLAAFIVIQLQYLFTSHADFSQFGLTYSEYVRKGFFELLLAVAAGAGLIYLAATRLKHAFSDAHQRLIALTSSLLTAELVVLLLSAARRNALYVDLFGLTRTRILGYAVLIWLAVLLAMMLVVVWWRHTQEKWLVWGIVGSLSIMVLGLNIVNIDGLIAHRLPNYGTFDDYFYLANLSADASSEWLPALQTIDQRLPLLLSKTQLSDSDQLELANYKLALLTWKQRRDDLAVVIPHNDWRYLHPGRAQTAQLIWNNRDLFYDRVDQLLVEIDTYAKTHAQSISEFERQLFYHDYPFVDVAIRRRYRP